MGPLEQAEKLAELSSIGERALGAEAALARLGELLGDEDDDVRAEAAGACAPYVSDGTLAERLLALAADDPALAVRCRALSSLGALLAAGDLAGAEEAGYEPQSELGEPDAELYGRAKQLLLASLPDESAVGDAALEALAVLSHLDAVREAILNLAQGDAAAQARALRCVARSGDPRWEQTVRDALEADDPSLVSLAIEAAGRAEITGAVPLLSRILKGSRQPLNQRLQAASALGRLGGSNTAAVLLEVAESADTDSAVREAAQMALVDLTLLGDLPELPKESA